MELEGFTGRVALVTGAARGIGRCIAETFASLGARTAAGDLEAPRDLDALGVEMDVSDEASVEEAFARVEGALGDVDLLVLNAGVYSTQPLVETSYRDWRRTIEVNLDGAFLCARRAIPAMRSRGYGRIVAVGSSAGVTGGAVPCAAYAASKAGLMTLAKSIASEFAPHGITCNAVAPALIDTQMIGGIAGLVDRIPVGRVGRPEDVAGVVAFLCSAHAGYITGEVVDVNGGFLID
jgi:NAD(P)-dependent dehydrogenase (short-subunit alcohol dehydrogenase family)